MNSTPDNHDDPDLRARLQAAYNLTPPVPLSAKVVDLARVATRRSPPVGASRPVGWRDGLAPAATALLLTSLFGGAWPFVWRALAGALAPSGSTAQVTPPGSVLTPALANSPLPNSALEPALAALLIPLVLAWTFELTRGARGLRRLLG